MLRKLFSTTGKTQLFAFLHQVVVAASGFATIFILARWLPQDELGRWLLFISLISLSDMVLHGVLQTIVIKQVVRDQQHEEALRITLASAFAISFLLILILSAMIGTFAGITLAMSVSWIPLIDLAAWYPVIGFSMLIFNLSIWLNMGRGNFAFIFWQRLIQVGTSLTLVLSHYFIFASLSFSFLVMSHIAGYAVASFYAWNKNRFILSKRDMQSGRMKEQFGYGRITLGTMIGSSLLRNADGFMISAYMNNAAVAVYVLAQKLVEIFEVILRSVAVTSLPLFHQLKNDSAAFSRAGMKRWWFLTMIFLPMAALLFFFAEHAIHLMSGSGNYAGSAMILRVFMVYVLLLPADRLIGVALESIDRPKMNMIKTLLIIAINITGNYIALNHLHSLIAVAAVSSLALGSGILLGLIFLKKSGAIKRSKRQNIQIINKPTAA